jgi:hypothetical protein
MDDFVGDNDDQETDKVGYCKPPAKTRFKPGQSGNPRGRKKGRKNIATIINDPLYEKATVRINGRARTLCRIEAVMQVTMAKALSGDLNALAKIVELANKFGKFEFPHERPASTGAREKLARLIRLEMQKDGSDVKDADLGTQDSKID